MLQREGRFETLVLAEEKIALQIPIGADCIESPGTSKFDFLSSIFVPLDLKTPFCFTGGYLYQIKWTQDQFGKLKIRDYYPDVDNLPML